MINNEVNVTVVEIVEEDIIWWRGFQTREKAIWTKILVSGPKVKMGQKLEPIDDGEYIYHGLLPIKEVYDVYEDNTYECSVDFIEESPVWKALKQK